jgi:hypothetical protein
MKNEIAYTAYGQACSYEPKAYIGTLDWFNIAQCARERMTDRAHDLIAWRGERRSFYTALQRMDVHNVGFMD